jgi:hypothetical protein
MIRERVATNGIVRPLEPERDIPALNIDPTTLGIISARWAQVYLAGVQRHEKKYASSIRQIEQRRKRAIALLRSRAEASQEEEATAEVEGEGWSVAWALDDAHERPPPSSLVARCDTAEALALARSAAVTKRKRNARLAAGTSSVSVSLRGTRKSHAQDPEEKVKKAMPAGDLWRRLSRGHGVSSAVAATDTAGVRPQVIVAA